ncbi:hypothetical protein HNQ60_005311 [Povalibacter uvarum]|uniref:Lumazine-binding protein n=1 Tax=Povalibacter uvarum TaxID=732238 RepID=A0A841HVV5_9GAMM|nr:nuclear transport factor 2 family protein [Povalibacter uvarum]MBB6096389.1 hypothetical protein [Povalibacter uvarum]
MKTSIARLLTCLVGTAVSPSVAADPLDTALDAYVEGLRKGDLNILQGLFLGEGQFCMNRQEGIRCSSFAAVLPSWIEKPDAQAAGRVRSREVIGSMARVTYQLDFNGTSYLDHLLLYESAGRWRVVAKTTWVEK